MNDLPVVAAKLEFEYLRMVPLKTDLHIEASVSTGANPKRVEINATLKLPTGEACVTGKGSFAILAKAQFAAVTKNGAVDPLGILNNPRIKWSAGDAG
jgi:acyl-CoA thioesterase FadM